ncbi:MAG TPA: aminotransferase class IV [Candidatus Paceibacterota bacterium]|nr:aminotransferase class IV [Candidatus Paceibacterota bacterium]HRS47956.1 aminotransferase class IV [Candidatus Paceibacterota bacterium]
MTYFYLNGKILPEKKVKISPFDAGFLRAYGIFEVVRTYKSKPIELDKHLDRLLANAKILKINHSYNKAKIKKAVSEIISKNKFKESELRIILTGGVSKNPFFFSGNTLLIVATKFLPYPKKYYQNGACLGLKEYQRELPEVKTLNYSLAVSFLKEFKNCLEVLYYKNNYLLETTFANFFLFKDDKLITPKSGILKGITRETVLNLARHSGFKVQEREVVLRELKEADEAFITSTIKGIMPIVKVSQFKIGNGRVGKKTKILMKKFEEYLKTF